jgi:hypothetical protein
MAHPGLTPAQIAKSTNRSQYDTLALKERADQWRVEAQAATSQEMRALCLEEAEKYERRVQKSQATPVFRRPALP